jgi:hypothetical protein
MFVCKTEGCVGGLIIATPSVNGLNPVCGACGLPMTAEEK